MNEEQLLPYLKLMQQFAAKENEAVRKSWGLTATPERHAQSIENSRLGGRSELIADDVELSPIAKRCWATLKRT
jgi:hypothetical protein